MKTPTHYKMPTSKKEAKKVGALYYINRKECRNGHISIRYTATGKCVACTKANRVKHALEKGLKKFDRLPSNARNKIEELKETKPYTESWEEDL